MASRSEPIEFQAFPGLLSFAIPGAGYLLYGDRLRAGLVFAGIMGLFLGGMLIGGVEVVTRQQDNLWKIFHIGLWPLVTMTRVLLGAASSTPSVGRVNEIGSLFVAMASFLNAIAAVDCLWHPLRQDRRNEDLL